MNAKAEPAVAAEAERSGTLSLRLTGIRYAAHGIHMYEFRRAEGDEPLPPFTPGAHVDLHLADGMVRQYSLVNPPEDRARYLVGVKRDPASRGGSVYMHDQMRVGSQVEVGGPRNNFELAAGDAPSVFIAGGIGITPIACMAARLRAEGRPWALHYSVRERREAALLDRLEALHTHLHVDAERGSLLDIAAIVQAAPPGAQLYCCGPAPMLDAFEAAAAGRDPATAHVERFTPIAPLALGGGYTVRLAASGRSIPVLAGQTILDALREAGIEVQASCEQGICGTCETRVLRGLPDHRDSLLSAQERARNDVMMICCSGCLGDELVLDL